MSDAIVGTTPPSEDGQAGQPQEQQAQGQGQPAEVVSLKDFREFQSAKDREIAQARAEAAQARKYATELATRGMSEAEKIRFENEQLKAERAAWLKAEQERQQLAELEAMKLDDAKAVAEAMEVPVEPLLKANSYREMLSIAKKERTRVEKAAGQPAKTDANRTYIPVGTPSTPQQRATIDYKTAIEKRDGMAAALAALAELSGD